MAWRKQHKRKPTKKTTFNPFWPTQQSGLVTFQRRCEAGLSKTFTNLFFDLAKMKILNCMVMNLLFYRTLIVYEEFGEK
jgi:hypothetical protein